MGYGNPIVETSSTEVPSPAPPPRYTLAQMLTAIVALGASFAAGRMVFTWQQNSMLEWSLVAAGFALSSLALAMQRNLRGAEMAAGAGIAFFLVWPILLPTLQSAREYRDWDERRCMGNLRAIGLAMHMYHEEYGSFPPAVVNDAQGRPMHSWRVLLLPYLEQRQFSQLYRFDEPWDGPNNKKLHNQIVDVYCCPEDHPNQKSSAALDTSYVVIVGYGTAFPGGRRKVSVSDIASGDGASNALLIVEIADSGIHWMEPRDLEFATMDFQVNGQKGASISSKHTGGAMVAMADGSVRYLDAKTPPSVVRQLITIKDGQPLPENLGVPAD